MRLLFSGFTGSDPKSRYLSPVLRLALLLGILVHLIGFLLFRVISSPLPVREDKRPFITYLPPASMLQNESLEQRASLFDSAPLFVPTRWSASVHIYPEASAYTIRIFDDYEPSIRLQEELRPERFPMGEGDGVERPEDLISLQFMQPFSLFGLGDVPEITLEDWSPVVRVRHLNEGESGAEVYPADLSVDNLPVLSSVERPAVYYVNKSNSGMLLSRPLLTQSSGNADLDGMLMDWLLEPSTLAGLPSGYLEVSVFR